MGIMEFIKYISNKKALYRTKDGFKIKKLIKEPLQLVGSELSLFKRYKSSAKVRGYEFDLSMDTFSRLIKSNCLYCGTEPAQKHGTIEYNGIDRLENDEGYNINNCLACCGMCNRVKGIMTRQEFYCYIKKLYSHNKNILEYNNIFEIMDPMYDILKQAGGAVQFLENED